MADKDFTAAPGVRATTCQWGNMLTGERDALVKSGLVDPEWFPDGIARTKGGRIIDRRITLIGGLPVEVSEWVKDEDKWIVSFRLKPSSVAEARRGDKLRRDYDGRTKVAWADCAWQPNASVMKLWCRDQGKLVKVRVRK